MKLARQKQLLRFFQWLVGLSAKEFLGHPQTPRESLETLPIKELEALHQKVHQAYIARFKHS